MSLDIWDSCKSTRSSFLSIRSCILFRWYTLSAMSKTAAASMHIMIHFQVNLQKIDQVKKISCPIMRRFVYLFLRLSRFLKMNLFLLTQTLLQILRLYAFFDLWATNSLFNSFLMCNTSFFLSSTRKGDRFSSLKILWRSKICNSLNAFSCMICQLNNFR